MTSDDIHSCHPWCTRPECIEERTGVFPKPAEISPGMEFVFKWLYKQGARDEREACAVAAEKWIQEVFESSASFGYSDLGNAIRARMD